MRLALPAQRISIELADEWRADEMSPMATAAHGIYLRSTEHGVYFNVRTQAPGQHALTRDGLIALLREQSWSSAPFDEWVSPAGRLTIVGGTFETLNMGGEVVLEVFVTDGHGLINLVGPGERPRIAAVTPSVERLAGTVRFGAR